MTNDLQKRFTSIKDLILKSKDQFRMALPKHMSVDRLFRISLTCIQKTPALLECDAKSLLGAIMQSAQLGLEPDGVLGQAYILPYRNKKTKAMEAQFQIGYKGLLSLAYRSKELSSFSARVVHEKDKFEFEYGLEEKLVHVPTQEKEPGKMVCAYAVARFKDGGYAFDVMFENEIEKVERQSQSSGSDYSPWKLWKEAMWKKTVAKRLCKMIPQSIELQEVASRDEIIDLGIDNLPEQIEEATETKTRQLEEKLKTKTKKKEKVEPEEEVKDENIGIRSDELGHISGIKGDEWIMSRLKEFSPKLTDLDSFENQDQKDRFIKFLNQCMEKEDNQDECK